MNNMRKKHHLARAAMTLLVAVLSFMSTGARAENVRIVVWLSDGSNLGVLFTDKPEISYADGDVTLKCQKLELSWPIASVLKLTFDDNTTEVKGVEAADIDSLSDDSAVYDLKGQLVKKQIKSLSEVPKGTYIVKDGSVTIKVVRK